MRDPLVKEREKRILGRDGEHIVHLHELARGIEHVMGQTIAVDGQVDGVNGGVRRESDANRGQNAAGRKLGEPKLKEQDRNATLQHVRKIVEEKGPAKKLCLGHRIVQHERHEGAERPEQKQIAGNALTRQHRDRQKHGRKRAEVERQILQRTSPPQQIKEDRSDPEKGEHTQNGQLHAAAPSLEQKIKTYVQQDRHNQ